MLSWKCVNIAVEDQKCKLAHAAVLLLAANREVNMRRRDLIRPDLNKQFSSLCNPSIAISAYLFGDDLDKEVEELTKSNKLSGKVTPKHRSDYRPTPYKIPFGRGTRGRGRFNQPSGRGRGSKTIYVFFRRRPGSVPAPSKQQDTNQQRTIESSNKVSSTMISSVIDNQPPFRAGGLKDCVHAWTEITSDPFVLDTVAHCHLEFDSLPESGISSSRPYFTFNESEQKVIDGEIDKFLQKGIIKPSFSESGEVLSPIFVIPKKDGSSRMIFNLKGLNQFISYHHFKMDTLEEAIKLMRPGCLMTSIDLRDAYYSIPIAPEHQKYLKFIWKDNLYCFTCLPMGLSSSPRIFTKVMKPVFATLRSKFGHTCLGYIDDSFYTEESYDECLQATFNAVELITSLGFKIHPDKSVIIPSQCIEFLGFLLDSSSMTVTLTPRKKEKLRLLCQQFLQPQRSFTICQVASLIGSLVSSFPGVQFGPLHYRPIEVDKDYHLRLHQGNFDAEMSLSPDSLAELHWWVNNSGAANKKVYQASPDVILYTDASGAGWGAKIENRISTCGIWSHDESVKHINCLELLAIHLALLSLFKNRNNIHVRIMCDNTTAVSYINEMGGMQIAGV